MYLKTQHQDIDIRSEIAEVCLEPGYLVETLSSVFFEKTKHASGHIHFYFWNKTDHIVFTWLKGRLKKIVAKSPSCKKGRYVHWKGSQFCDYKREDTLEHLRDEIECIEIDRKSFSRAWPSYAGSVKWLTQN